jgi:hypothetical protein
MHRFLLALLLFSSLCPMASAQTEAERATIAWRACRLLDEYKTLAQKAAESAASANQCQNVRDQLRLQHDRTLEELRQAKSDLESARLEISTARQEAEVAKANLAGALRWRSVSAAYIRRTRASECPATARSFLYSLPDFTEAKEYEWGATASSPTCGATVWCTGPADKDGDPYMFWAVTCADGRADSIRDQIKTLPGRLR